MKLEGGDLKGFGCHYPDYGPGLKKCISCPYRTGGYLVTDGVPVKGVPREQNQEFKADGGKLEPSLLFAGMPRALYAVVAVLQYGKQKYEAHSWKRVEGERYDDARLRHVLDNYLEEDDQESDLYHMAHEVTNALFQIEKKLEALGPNWKDALKFKAPPTAHKEKVYEVPTMPGCGCLMAGAQCDARVDCGLRNAQQAG